MKRGSMWKTTVLWILTIAVLSIFLHPHKTVGTTTNEKGITFQSASGYEVEVCFDQVENLQLVDEFDYGTLVDGTENRKEKSGIFQNASFGQYRLCVNTKIPKSIIIRTANDICVVNYESEKSTEELYEAMSQVCAVNTQT